MNERQELEEQYRRADGTLDLPEPQKAADKIAEEEEAREAAEKAAWREKIGQRRVHEVDSMAAGQATDEGLLVAVHLPQAAPERAPLRVSVRPGTQ